MKILQQSLLLMAFSLSAGSGALAAEPVSLKDTDTSQDIASVLMRPDGAAVAYVTLQADLGTNKNLHTLKVVPTRGGEERALLTTDKLYLGVRAGAQRG